MIDPADTTAFPLDPWSEIPTDADAQLEQGVAWLVDHYAAPRDAVLARRFLNEAVPEGRLCLYGASSITARMIEWLDGRDGTEIVGIIDRNASTIQQFHGFPVIAPADLPSISYDHVLIAHPLHEMDMIETLLAAGLPPDRIFPLYDNPGFAQMALPVHRARVAPALALGGRYCIVGSSHMHTIPDQELARLLPAAETVLLHFSPYEPLRPSSIYRTIDLASSTSLLIEALQQLAPEVVVLRSTGQLGFLASVIKTAVPDAVLLHDFYDFTTLLPQSLMRGWMAMSQRQITISHLAEYHSLRTSDVGISKRGGRWWNRMLAPTTRPYVSFFPGGTTELQPHTPEAKQPDERWRVLYAGVLLAPKPGEYAGDYNFLSLFETLAASNRFSFKLYNSIHADGTQDGVFAHFLQRYPGEPIEYHRRVSYPALHAEARQCHFGWLYREAGGEVPFDAATGMPARCLGYLTAGLPVILDDKWGYLQDLVASHHAGIVLPQGDSARLPEILESCDLERLRAGAKSLLRFFLDHNEAGIVRLHRYLREDRGLAALPPLLAPQRLQ